MQRLLRYPEAARASADDVGRGDGEATAPDECTRCGELHPGLCPALEFGARAVTMRALGVAPGWVDEQALTERRKRSVQIMHGVISPKGRDMEMAVASCGLFAARSIDGTIRAVQQRCRVPACALCQTVRGREVASELRIWLARRIALGEQVVFATFTTPKPEGLDPRPALNATRRAFRKLTDTARASGREFWSLVAGIYFVFENTWSAKGTPRKHGGVVPYSGYHSHVHALIELRDGVWREDAWPQLRALWCELTGGNPRAQDCQIATDAHCSYVASYVSGCVDETMPIPRARELYVALYGLRMFGAQGTWRHWRKEVAEQKPKHVIGVPVDEHGERMSLDAIVAMARCPATAQEPIRFVDVNSARAGSVYEIVHERMPAAQVFAELRRSFQKAVAQVEDAKARARKGNTS